MVITRPFMFHGRMVASASSSSIIIIIIIAITILVGFFAMVAADDPNNGQVVPEPGGDLFSKMWTQHPSSVASGILNDITDIPMMMMTMEDEPEHQVHFDQDGKIKFSAGGQQQQLKEEQGARLKRSSLTKSLTMPVYFPEDDFEDITFPNITQYFHQLYKKGYDSRLRPYVMGKPVQVTCSMFILSISQISESFMDFTVDFYFRQTWTDVRLSWDSDHEEDAIAESITISGDYAAGTSCHF